MAAVWQVKRAFSRSTDSLKPFAGSDLTGSKMQALQGTAVVILKVFQHEDEAGVSLQRLHWMGPLLDDASLHQMINVSLPLQPASSQRSRRLLCLRCARPSQQQQLRLFPGGP